MASSRAMAEKIVDDSVARVRPIAQSVKQRGGRALLVGGSVRDRLLGRPVHDTDVEVLGLDQNALETALAPFGRVSRRGRHFEILHVENLDIDFSACPESDYAVAAKRRDLTINSMGLDPLSGEVLDPNDGRRDLRLGRLRASDPMRFGEDALRAIRVARFVAQLGFEVDAELKRLCGQQDLSSIPGERIQREFEKILLETQSPSAAFGNLEEVGLLRFFPELEALVGVSQDPKWHPEGDVWIHTLMAIDEAAALRVDPASDLPLMFAVLCHDFGKPERSTTQEGRIRSLGHDRAGVAPTEAFLERIQASRLLTKKVCCLVEHHLAPAQLIHNEAGPRGYRRLARRLGEGGVSMQLLERVARADHLGRTTADAKAKRFVAGDDFLTKTRDLRIEEKAPTDIVTGSHLIARGIQPGPQFGRILERCRQIQDETGETDPEAILSRIL